MVFMALGLFPWFFKVVSMVVHGFWLVYIIFNVVSWFFHGFWLVSMVFQGLWLVSIVLLVENTTKLYPGPTIQSRPCRP